IRISSGIPWFCCLPSVGGAGCHRLAVEAIAIERFWAEVQGGGHKLFSLTKKEISAGLQVEMQALEQRQTLGAGKVRQHVHTEYAVEAADVAGAGEIHSIEGHQAAQARLYQQMRCGCRSGLGSALGSILRSLQRTN